MNKELRKYDWVNVVRLRVWIGEINIKKNGMDLINCFWDFNFKVNLIIMF